VETDAGIKVVELLREGGRADMGAPSLQPERVPVRLPGSRAVEVPVDVGDRSFAMTCVSMGNPHAVVFVDDVERFDVARYGPLLERHELFPDRVNASFVQVLDRGRVVQRTWERGSGETQACGTGACAVCVAGRVTGRTGDRIVTRLRGGALVVEWDGRGSVFLTGPAVEVFTGEWPGEAAGGDAGTTPAAPGEGRPSGGPRGGRRGDGPGEGRPRGGSGEGRPGGESGERRPGKGPGAGLHAGDAGEDRLGV
jgi:diaminopimelate epimerase